MFVIVAADLNWGIGKNGKLLFPIPEDLNRFKRLTMNKTVVMGRLTLESLPKGKPLAGRRNIVLTQKGRIEGAECAASLDEFFELIKDEPEDNVAVIGGESVYRQLLPYSSYALVTRIYKAFESDCSFPDLDADPSWSLDESSPEHQHLSTPYTYLRYARR